MARYIKISGIVQWIVVLLRNSEYRVNSKPVRYMSRESKITFLRDVFRKKTLSKYVKLVLFIYLFSPMSTELRGSFTAS